MHILHTERLLMCGFNGTLQNEPFVKAMYQTNLLFSAKINSYINKIPKAMTHTDLFCFALHWPELSHIMSLCANEEGQLSIFNLAFHKFIFAFAFERINKNEYQTRNYDVCHREEIEPHIQKVINAMLLNTEASFTQR